MDLEKIKDELAGERNVNRALVVASMALQIALLHCSELQRESLSAALGIVLDERTD